MAERVKTEPINPRISAQTRKYLERLMHSGAHGYTVTEVAKTLIWDQLKELERQGKIKLEYDSNGTPKPDGFTVVFVVVFGGLALWSLYHPVPQPRHRIAEQNAQHSDSSQDHLRGTERAPVFVKVLPTAPDEIKTAEKGEHARDYLSPEFMLVYVTAILAGYTALLWGSTQALVRSERELIEKQERPYLYVFDVMMPPKRSRLPPPPVPMGSSGILMTVIEEPPDPTPNFMVYDVGNFGKAPAIIDNVLTGIELRVDGRPPGLLREDENHRLFVSFIMKPDKQQDKIRGNFPDDMVVSDMDQFYVPQTGSIHELYFHILIRYHGPFSKGHETEGWWRYDIASKSFVRVSDDGHNRVT